MRQYFILSLLLTISPLTNSTELAGWVVEPPELTNSISTTTCLDKNYSNVEVIGQAAVEIANMIDTAVSATMSSKTQKKEKGYFEKSLSNQSIGQYIYVRSLSTLQDDDLSEVSKITFSDIEGQASILKLWSELNGETNVSYASKEWVGKQLSESIIINLLLSDPTIKFYVEEVAVQNKILKCAFLSLKNSNKS